MTISVAIATYNRAAMVREAVDAALAQSPAPDEIVVADDASTDGTREALASLAAGDPRVLIIRQQKNSGGVENWNAAMTATRGDLIAWCSDDDRYLPGHLEAAHEYLKTHPEVGLVHSGFVDALEFAGEGARTEFRPLRSQTPLLVNRRNLFPYLIRHYDWPFHPSTIVMRREVWEQVGSFDPAYALADTDWFVRAAEQYSAALLPRHGTLNRRHGGNWSNRVGSAQMQTEIFAIVDRAMLRRWPAPSSQRVLWRAVWRVNVCLRLALTMRARIRGGHAEAACAAWQALLRLVGRCHAGGFGRLGEKVIRQRAERIALPVGSRQSLSPL
jgi:glycosyltransferase involved in cell wall biosynthesis